MSEIQYTQKTFEKVFTISGLQKTIEFHYFLSLLVYVPFRTRPFCPFTLQLSLLRFFFNNIALPKLGFSFSLSNFPDFDVV